MTVTEQLQLIARWSGYFTLFCAAIMALGLVLKWGVRFRLVGVTSFMTVLSLGLFTLSLSFHIRPNIPDAVRFSRVYDTGTATVVVAVQPDISEMQLAATMRQAAVDLFSYGRLSQGADQLTIRFRTVLHPQPDVSQPVYLGQVKRSLSNRDQTDFDIQIDPASLVLLPKPSQQGS
jgi:Protein of function (DUF2518)